MSTLRRREDRIKARPRIKPYDWKWAKASKGYLKKNRLCVVCKKEGTTRVSECTDHVVPVSEGGAMWDQSNWQALCYHHHSQKTILEQKGRCKV